MMVFPLPGREALIPKGNRSTREVARHGRCLQQVELTAKPLFIDYSSSRLSASTACLRHPPRPVCRPGMPGDQNASSSGWFTDAVRNGNARQQRFRTQTGVSTLVSPLSRKAFSAMFSFGGDGSFPSAERKNPSPGPKCRPESGGNLRPLPESALSPPGPGYLDNRTAESIKRTSEQQGRLIPFPVYEASPENPASGEQRVSFMDTGAHSSACQNCFLRKEMITGAD